MINEDQVKSIKQRLVNLANKLNVSYQAIATSFLIERLAIRLTMDEKMADSLVFKGGYVGLRIYQSSRFTMDLDALLVNLDFAKALKEGKRLAQQDIGDGVWFVLDSEENLATQGQYGGFRQIYRTGIGEPPINLSKAQKIHFDIGIGDVVIPPASLVETKELIGDGEICWLVYPIETIIAEKIHALVVRAEFNSRSKDIYDISIFLPKANLIILNKAIESCFQIRKTDLPPDLSGFIEKIDTSILKSGWNNAVSSLYNPPKFEAAYSAIVNQLARPILFKLIFDLRHGFYPD